ncbi:unnamed protein product [Adineta ricciae]|uniref:Uncharacterized protein n=1 Tax=Adineta ricciae TaxID=249248 RepID=A0A815AVH9_ADIRI|nr:unnamed protein product [Adineta ricciae]
MVTCEETSCTVLPAAICLHCNRRLCTSHIVAHGVVLLGEADELCQQISEVAEHLNNSSEDIQVKHSEAIAALDAWRQKEIDQIEDQYTEKIQIIEAKQDYLIDLENNLILRLTKNARDPLEQMQTQKNASRQMAETIQQVLVELKQECRKLTWNSADSPEQHLPITDQGCSLGQNHPATDEHIPCTSVNSSGMSNLLSYSWLDFVPLVKPQSEFSSDVVSSAQSPFIDSPIDLQHLPVESCQKFIDFFLNVSGSHDQSIDNFLNNCPNQTVYLNNFMCVLLSFLEAWHPKSSPKVFNERVLSYHIFTIKKHITNQDSQRVIIAAILVYIHSCNYDQIRSGQIMSNLFHQFLDHKCLSKAFILDWYENSGRCNYPNIPQAKQWAASFIDYLNSPSQSMQT